MRTEPPWSPPVATSTTPAATSAALPLDDPPAERVSSHGLRTGPVREVCEPPEKHRSSQTALPMIVEQAGDDRGVAARHEPLDRLRPVHHRDAGDGGVVLDRDRPSGQWAASGPC